MTWCSLKPNPVRTPLICAGLSRSFSGFEKQDKAQKLVLTVLNIFAPFVFSSLVSVVEVGLAKDERDYQEPEDKAREVYHRKETEDIFRPNDEDDGKRQVVTEKRPYRP